MSALSQNKVWVKGFRQGVPYYLNLHTAEETFIKPQDFKEPKISVPQQECTDNAIKNAQQQFEAGQITKEEYEEIITIINKGQEVDDIHQFLNNSSVADHPVNQDSVDPGLLIVDKDTGKKVNKK